jgi:glutamate synthase domain-containing protein 2/glutamate synthase domain-containing protein 1/glutamate synthase domain-containing protein 3
MSNTIPHGTRNQHGASRAHPDHDACGTGFVVKLSGAGTHEVVDRALTALQRLSHRGGVDADGASGDGAGLLTALPQKFLRREAESLGIELPLNFGLGMLFMPRGQEARIQREIKSLASAMGVQLLGWRGVPTNPSVPGERAAETLPAVWQCFFASSFQSECFERQLFLLRKRAEAELGSGIYFCSLSSRTVVYKGLLAPWQLPLFYRDLWDLDFESSFAIFHQRFSTNTQPAWSLAQPFRFVAHNGEINTITGNRRWMQARQPAIRGKLKAGRWFHALEENVSDSASLDNALELLVRQGQSAEASLFSLVPPVLTEGDHVAPAVRQFFDAAAAEYEPWDGPAALIFSDGRVVGAKLDRNGLRPLRTIQTSDGWLIAGSEAGLADFDEKTIIERHRLGPGEMLLVDLTTGRVRRNGDLMRDVAAQAGPRSPRKIERLPHEAACEAISIVLLGQGDKASVPVPAAQPSVFQAKQVAAGLGWTEDQLRILLQPLTDGKEAIWSMGDDTPPAFMSKIRRTIWDYCKQRFAQVTNPPIDPLREAHVMSLETRLGSGVTGRGMIADSPVLGAQQMAFVETRLTPCQRIDATFDASLGATGAVQAFEGIRNQVRWSHGVTPTAVVLSDRGVSADRAALPILLAASAVWQEMAGAANYQIPLIVETAQVIDTHHIAMLIAVGATAVQPYLALQLAEEIKPGGPANYSVAVAAGLRKVLSRMGISTLASYRNAQLFEVVGLDGRLCREFFESAPHCAEATALEQVLADYLYNHTLAFHSAEQAPRDAGLYRFRKEGEVHGTTPELMRRLHAHVKSPTPTKDSYRAYEDLAEQREPTAVRDLLKVTLAEEPTAIEKVETQAELLRRFSAQAMSVGAISPEAHRTLALAMNELGARSNTGEGGEDAELYSREPEAASRIKQVASGRFGVTTEYLVNAHEIEIKMAQGSKPGEGGQLPAMKVSAFIAKLRRAVPGMALISPPPHHDIYSIEDLEQLIHDLRKVNPRVRIGVKLVAGAGVGIIAAGVAKAGADVITISGHDGGTGASPLSSIKNTGLPWEFGLRDAHRTLVQCGLRRQVRLRVDGGLKFARDIIIAALLGADEFGFGTAALLAIGCVMARQCHLNTCPVGIATQDEKLRMRFAGKPEMVKTFFQSMADETRELLAKLGARSLDEIVGHTEFLQPRSPESAGWVDGLLRPAGKAPENPDVSKKPEGLSRELLAVLNKRAGTRPLDFHIQNADRSIGAELSGELLRRYTTFSTDSAPMHLRFRGSAGQSFGAFLIAGLSFHLSGEANDYVGKGLSGGTIAIDCGAEASLRGDVLAGNTVLYGATSGELYVAGRAGERFAVRNSGALAVVEGVGDHGCEYMTGGVAVVLGSTGINFGSGMTGGLAYMVADQVSQRHLNSDFVRVEPCTPMEEGALRQVLIRHSLLTGSPRATFFLNVGPRLPFVRIQPAQLPCTVEQTWAPILQRLHTPTLSVIHGLAVSSGRPKRGVSVPADVNVAGLADLDQAASGC